MAPAVTRRLESLRAARTVDRIWAKDPSVWGGTAASAELSNRLGWLEAPDRAREALSAWTALADFHRPADGQIVLCGMGGSSLAADVFHQVLAAPAVPSFRVLDSTAPGAIEGADPSMVIVSSKSGSTIETRCLLSHYWEVTGGDRSRFIAIADSGTPLARLATERGFAAVFPGDPDVGGRFSALTAFGLVPAALAGLDIEAIVSGTSSALDSCRNPLPEENTGAWLGAVLGEAAVAGRDKLTLVLDPSLENFGLWAEQLVAESTGKSGLGLLPVVEDVTSDLNHYGADRLFVALSVGEGDADHDHYLSEVAAQGHPVVRLTVPNAASVGGEMFRWEFAVAVAGSILGVNPFDQPNVAEGKQNTQRVLRELGTTKLPAPATEDEMRDAMQGIRPGDYVGIQAYVAPSPVADRVLRQVAARLRIELHVPVTVGYGPRYLHSTGQLHKGGPPVGHFLQIVSRPDPDLDVPGEDFSFGDLLCAQAEGDRQALVRRGRPVLRVSSVDHLEALVGDLS